MSSSFGKRAWGSGLKSNDESPQKKRLRLILPKKPKLIVRLRIDPQRLLQRIRELEMTTNFNNKQVRDAMQPVTFSCRSMPVYCPVKLHQRQKNSDQYDEEE